MRRGWIVLLAPILLTGCSTSIPRLPAVYSPPPATAVAPATASQPADAAQPAASSADPGSGPAFDTSGWVKLTPSGESFSILMPGKAQESSGSIATPGGAATQTTWVANVGERSYGITRVRMNGAPPPAQSGTILDQAGQSVAGAVGNGATITSKRDTNVGSNPARRIVIENASTKVLVLIVLVDGQVITPYVGTPAGLADDGSAEAFLTSFEVAA